MLVVAYTGMGTVIVIVYYIGLINENRDIGWRSELFGILYDGLQHLNLRHRSSEEKTPNATAPDIGPPLPTPT